MAREPKKAIKDAHLAINILIIDDRKLVHYTLTGLQKNTLTKQIHEKLCTDNKFRISCCQAIPCKCKQHAPNPIKDSTSFTM